MADGRFFFTGPARVIGDNRPAALDLRCLAAIAIHDGMSKVKGTGAGCYAKHATLAAEVGTDVTNFSKSLSRLIAWGYVVREPQLMDKRRFTLRVVYDEQDSWRTDHSPEIVGEPESRNTGFSRQNGSQYISLNEEKDSEESRERNSGEPARFASRTARQNENCTSVGAILARLERALKTGQPLNAPEWLNWLEKVDCTTDEVSETERAWAQRLSEQVIELLSDEEFDEWDAARW